MRRFIVSAAILATLAGSSTARDITLTEALRLAEEHSHRLKQSQARTEAASQSLRAARSERFPTLSAAAAASYIDEVPRMEIGLPGLGSISRDFGTRETYQADLRLTVPLLTGGRISSAVDMAQAGRQYADASAQIDTDLLYYQTRLDYFGLYRALELRQAAQASLRRTEIIRKDVISRYEAGAADSVDLLESDLAHTRATFAVTQADIDLRAQEIRLLVRLGQPAGDQLDPADSLPEPPDQLDTLELSSGHPELDAAQAVIALGQAQVNSENSGFFPSLAASGGYSYGRPNLDRFANDWNDYWTVGAQLNWSFNLGFKTTARKRAAQYDLRAACSHRDDVTETLTRETDLALERLRLAHRRWLSSRDEYNLTSANYRLARIQHQSGVLSANRLLEIEAALTLAESSLAAARVDFYIAQSGYFYTLSSDKLGKGI